METDRQFVEALARGLRILDCFRTQTPVLGNADLARMTRLACSTVSRLTHTLVKQGYLEYDLDAGAYRLGLRVLALQPAALAHTGLSDAVVPKLRELAELTQETVLLSVFENYSLVTVKAATPSQHGPARPVGYSYPVSGTAMGRAYVASASEREQADIAAHLHGGDSQLAAALRAEFEEAISSYRANGYCTALGIASPGRNSIAVPLQLQQLGRRATLTVGGPSLRVSRRALHEHLGPLLVQSARAIERIFARNVNSRTGRNPQQ